MHNAAIVGVDDTLEDRLAEAGECEWVLAHQALSRLARQRAKTDAEEGGWLLRARRAAAHVYMGFGTFAEYVERSFGYCARTTHDKLRVAEALESLPALSHALESGTLCWSALRELTRVATPATEAAWLEVARGKLSRELEPLVAGASPGDLPNPSQNANARPHVLRFEVAPETYATFREAMLQLRRTSDTRIDDDAALLAMARAVLGGPKDDGRASYQLSLSVCPECGRGTQSAGGAIVAVGAEVVDMMACDAQHIGSVAQPELSQKPELEPTSVDCASMDGAAEPGEHAPAAELAPTVDRASSATAHVGTPTSPRAPTPTRAKQTIPPALRRYVQHRDRHRCRVPGCQNTTYLDVHHIVPRAEGGQNTAANLVDICGVHHRAAHAGTLLIDGTAENLRVRHADGTPYGQAADPRALDVQAKVFSALRNLGFRETEVRTVMDELRREPRDEAWSAERLLRTALERIRPRRGFAG